MSYPTIEEVEKADRVQLARWYRFLPSPGTRAIGKENFEEVLDAEVKIMNRIVEKFKELGFFTPEISKQIGW